MHSMAAMAGAQATAIVSLARDSCPPRCWRAQQAVAIRSARASLLGRRRANGCLGKLLSPLEMPPNASLMTCRHGKGWECRFEGIPTRHRGTGGNTCRGLVTREAPWWVTSDATAAMGVGDKASCT